MAEVRPPTLPGVDRLGRSIVRRAALRAWVRGIGVSLVAAAGLWACWIAGWKWSADAREWASWWLPGAALLGVALLAATAWAWARKWTLPRALLEADRSLGLKDRLRSGHDLLAGHHNGGEFEAWASQDAERVASSASASKVVAIKWDRSWVMWPALMLAAIAAGLWLPAYEPMTDPRQRASVTLEAVQGAKDLVREAQAIAQASTPGQPMLPVVMDRTQEELEAIEQELAKGTLDPQEARSRASSAIERQAKELEEHAERLKAERDALRDRMAAAASQSGQPEPSDGQGDGAMSTSETSEGVSRLGQRLSSGDFESAANEVDYLRRALDEMSPEDREAVAKELEALAERLDRSRDSAPTDAKSAAGAQAAADPGTRESASAGEDRSQADPGSRESSGTSEPPAPKPAQSEQGPSTENQPKGDAAEPPPGEREPSARERGEEREASKPTNPGEAQSDAQRRAEEKAQDVRDALRDAAREAREPANQRSPASTGDTKPDSAESPKATPGDAQPDSPRDSPGAQSDPTKPIPGQGQSPPSKPEPGADARDAKPNGVNESKPNGAEGQSPPAASKDSEQRRTQEQSGKGKKAGEEPREKPTAKSGDQAHREGEARPVPGSNQGVAPGQSRPADGQRTGDTGQEAKGESPDSQQSSPSPGAGQPKATGQDRVPTGSASGAKPDSKPAGDSKEGVSSERETKPTLNEAPGKGSPSPSPSPSAQENGPPADVPSPGSSTGQGLDRLKRTLEEQASKQREQRQSAEDAERMRQAAQEMLKEMTPEQRERMRELARSGRTPPQGQDGGVPMDVPGARSAGESGIGREAGKQRGGRGEAFKADDPSSKQTETVDARGDQLKRSESSGERVIAEWYSDRPHTGGTVRPAGDGLGETVRDAANGAQRAIEQQQVPGRHADLVRRVFRRYVERTTPAPTPVSPPATSPAPSAPPANPGAPR